MEGSKTKQEFHYCGLITLSQLCICVYVCGCVYVWVYLIKQFSLQQVTSFECIRLEN